MRKSHNQREANPNWSGDDATYLAVHQRLYRWRGPARTHACVDCDGRAATWSYDKTDPNELVDSQGRRYSTDADRYTPRCYRCHHKFDGGEYPAGEKHPNATVSDVDRQAIAKAFAAGENRNAIAARYGIGRRTVYKIAEAAA